MCNLSRKVGDMGTYFSRKFESCLIASGVFCIIIKEYVSVVVAM